MGVYMIEHSEAYMEHNCMYINVIKYIPPYGLQMQILILCYCHSHNVHLFSKLAEVLKEVIAIVLYILLDGILESSDFKVAFYNFLCTL